MINENYFKGKSKGDFGMKNKRHLILSIIILIIVGYLLYYFPIQRHFAEKTLKEYMSVQGTTNAVIDSKRIYKDYTIGGYVIEIIYQYDPDYTYNYTYRPLKGLKGKMVCIIFDKENVSADINNKEVKYPSID